MSLLFNVINPVVRATLASPLHRLMSHNTLVLALRGRKTGKRIVLPVSYHQQAEDQIHCFTGRSGQWWKNLRGGNTPVDVLYRGTWRRGSASVVTGPVDTIASALTDFLISVPRDAPHSGVKMRSNRTPDPDDVNRVAPVHVLIRIKLE